MRDRWLVGALALVLLAAAGLALSHIAAPSLWFDEGWSAYAADQPSLVAAANADATNPPLYYMTLHVATRLWGDSEFGLRVVSLFAGLLGIAVAARWIRETRGPAAALMTAIALAFMPLVWWAMREARMYTLLMLLALLAVWALDRLRRGAERWPWAVLIMAELAALYTHNTGPIIAIWMNALVLIVWITGQRPIRPRPLPWILSQVVVGLLWLPYFVTRFTALPAANSGLTQTVELTPTSLFALWQGFWQTPWERVLFGGEAIWLFAAMLVLFAVAVTWKWRQAWWPLAVALILIGGVLAGLIALGNEAHSRYLVVAAPFVAAAYGVAVARFRRPLVRTAWMLPPLALFAANLAYNTSPEAPFQHDDARALVRQLAGTLGPEDTVLAWSYADRYELAYYWDRLGIAAHRVTLPEAAGLDAIQPLLPTSGDAAINVWYTQRADFRGMLDCLIADGSAASPEVTTVHGMSSRLYRDIAPRAPALLPVSVLFGVAGQPLAELTTQGTLVERPADRALCLPLALRLAAETPGDLKAAVRVLNPLGDEIAWADAVFATDDQRTTSALNAGDSAEAWPLLRLPAGTPPGDYPVYLRIYDEMAEPSGYPPLSGDIRGRDVLLGVWRVPPGAAWEMEAEADLPLREPISVTSDLTLVASDAVTEGDLPVLRNGDRATLTLLWFGADPLPELELADADNRWSVPMPAPDSPHDTLTLDWRAAVIPASAEAGTSEVRLPDGTVIARWRIESLPLSTTLPPFETPVDALFPGVGSVAGFSGPDEWILGEPPQVTLVWQAGETPITTNYTVFLQLLDAQGRVIAQSDSVPAGGARPTTGWRPGEVVEDAHTLQWNELASAGSAELIAGLYDPVTGARVPLADGHDSVAMAGSLTVRP